MITAWLAWADEFNTSKVVSNRVNLYRSHGKLWHKGKLVRIEKPIREDNEICMYSFSENRAVNKLVREIFKCQNQ